MSTDMIKVRNVSKNTVSWRAKGKNSLAPGAEGEVPKAVFEAMGFVLESAGSKPEPEEHSEQQWSAQGPGESLADFKARIAASDDLDLLSVIAEKDDRKTVRAAAAERLDELTTPGNDG